MTRTTRLLVLTVVALVSGADQTAAAQGRKAAANFQGRWSWAVYARVKNELPPAYRHLRREEVPRHSLHLDLKQRGAAVTGEYNATGRFLAKLDDGDINTVVRGGTARVTLESGFGGRVTATITLRGNRLYWKVLRAEGVHYFPDEVVLRRARRRP